MRVARLRLAEAVVKRTQYYSADGGTDLAMRFFDATVASLRALEKMPNAGSRRVGELWDIPGLRVRGVAGFPVGWFYFVRTDHADVVRLLSDAQDLPVILAPLDLTYPLRSACYRGPGTGAADTVRHQRSGSDRLIGI